MGRKSGGVGRSERVGVRGEQVEASIIFSSKISQEVWAPTPELCWVD